jgi:hypothetical protein
MSIYLPSDGDLILAEDVRQIIRALSNQFGLTDESQTAPGRLVLPRSATQPSAPVAGETYFDTDSNEPFYYNGSAWEPMHGPFITRKAADQTIDSTTLANDNHFSFSIAANEIWRFHFLPLAADDFKYGFSLPVGASGRHAYFVNGELSNDIDNEYESDITVGQNPSLVDSTTALVTIDGFVVNGANAGTFQFQWAKNGDAGGGLTLLANSTMDRVRLA